jgi:hypothetical protein
MAQVFRVFRQGLRLREAFQLRQQVETYLQPNPSSGLKVMGKLPRAVRDEVMELREIASTAEEGAEIGQYQLSLHSHLNWRNEIIAIELRLSRARRDKALDAFLEGQTSELPEQVEIFKPLSSTFYFNEADPAPEGGIPLDPQFLDTIQHTFVTATPQAA